MEILKEVLGEIFTGVIIVAVPIFTLWLFAKITYKLAHRKTKHKKAHKRVQNKSVIEYSVGDTSKMYLFEIKQAKNKIKRQLIANI